MLAGHPQLLPGQPQIVQHTYLRTRQMGLLCLTSARSQQDGRGTGRQTNRPLQLSTTMSNKIQIGTEGFLGVHWKECVRVGYYCPCCGSRETYQETGGGDYYVGEELFCLECNTRWYMPNGPTENSKFRVRDIPPPEPPKELPVTPRFIGYH